MGTLKENLDRFTPGKNIITEDLDAHDALVDLNAALDLLDSAKMSFEQSEGEGDDVKDIKRIATRFNSAEIAISNLIKSLKKYK